MNWFLHEGDLRYKRVKAIFYSCKLHSRLLQLPHLTLRRINTRNIEFLVKKLICLLTFFSEILVASRIFVEVFESGCRRGL